MPNYVVLLSEVRLRDAAQVGGKNASLGEMIGELSGLGISVPDGFATTADAFREFLARDGLDERIRKRLATLDVDDIRALSSCAHEIREWIEAAPLPASVEEAVAQCLRRLARDDDERFAVRSSATAEDLPDASFAGQQDTLLNVAGLDAILAGIRHVYASLYTDRAIAYRAHRGFAHEDVALSVGIQRMVRTDVGAAGVMFTLDPESGFADVVLITSSYGLGELLVQGGVEPDEFYVHKPALAAGRQAIIRRRLGTKRTKLVYGDGAVRVREVEVGAAERRRFSLTDDEVLELARQALVIERHYGRPMDIEWGKDGIDGRLEILQARPETVQSRASPRVVRFELKQRGPVLVTGRSVGQRIAAGRARVIGDLASMHTLDDGDVLVTDMTDPAWEPVMKRAAAIVTNRGGRTCHAAIIARELGVPAVVGCGDATERVPDGAAVTVSCAEGDVGHVYDGALEFEQRRLGISELPSLPVKLMLNVGNPDAAFSLAAIPNEGVGLARIEFIINRAIGVHPLAIVNYERQDEATRALIDERAAGYDGPVRFFVDKLAEGIATIAAAFAPKPVIVRLSDFKSNEYANLIGGAQYEPREENPMLGLRGAARYLDDEFRAGFELECRALEKVRKDYGFTNVEVMVPFVRSVDEGRRVVELLERNGLRRSDGLRIVMMCELPTNALLADAYLEIFDGMSIGSNDMTQLVLGVDRDSERVASSFDERDPAVKRLLALAIAACRAQGKYVGICGQAPSDYPELAEWLTAQGIDSLSLNPDSIVETWLRLGRDAERAAQPARARARGTGAAAGLAASRAKIVDR
ncbi:MAG: phosphoenolpyruvate synthase [Gammaproteobacteria bacterium]|nr:phosphoenolpyruvate synthase [Gammaproteobacteria bacterium]